MGKGRLCSQMNIAFGLDANALPLFDMVRLSAMSSETADHLFHAEVDFSGYLGAEHHLVRRETFNRTPNSS